MVEAAPLSFVQARAPFLDSGETFENEQEPITLLCVDAVQAVIWQPFAHDAIVAAANRAVVCAAFDEAALPMSTARRTAS